MIGSHDHWERQGRIARQLSLEATINEQDAKGLVFLLVELLNHGASYRSISSALCFMREGQGIDFCQNRITEQKRERRE